MSGKYVAAAPTAAATTASREAVERRVAAVAALGAACSCTARADYDSKIS